MLAQKFCSGALQLPFSVRPALISLQLLPTTHTRTECQLVAVLDITLPVATLLLSFVSKSKSFSHHDSYFFPSSCFCLGTLAPPPLPTSCACFQFLSTMLLRMEWGAGWACTSSRCSRSRTVTRPGTTHLLPSSGGGGSCAVADCAAASAAAAAVTLSAV